MRTVLSLIAAASLVSCSPQLQPAAPTVVVQVPPPPAAAHVQQRRRLTKREMKILQDVGKSLDDIQTRLNGIKSDVIGGSSP